MRILVAPDKYKGSLPATSVADAMSRGARTIHPDASFALRPIADGGEGTLDAFMLALGGRVRDLSVPGPLGEPVQARLATLRDGTTVIEMADSAGLVLVDPNPQVSLTADTAGVGGLLRAAVDAGAGRVIVGIGGSASTDGGTGAARACGWRFLDRSGDELPPGGGALADLDHIEPPAHPIPLEVIGACDVDAPLTGEAGAARVFGPQKGADADAITRLQRGLERVAEVIRSDLGVDVAAIAHGGAGGGLGAGLVAFFGGSLRPGLELLAEATGLRTEVNAADLVITGEGRLDDSSLSGKAPVAIAAMAREARTPCVAIVGDLLLERHKVKKAGFDDAVGLVQSGGASLADSDPERAIEKATEGILRSRLEKKQGRSFRK